MREMSAEACQRCPSPRRAWHLPALSCSCHAWPHVANKQTCPYRWNSINGGSQLPGSLAGATANYKANAMGFAILPHTEIVNHTKGLMLLHVPRTLTLCFMVTTVKTRSVLKLSWSLRPLLQFYLSCPFKGGTKAYSRSCTSFQTELSTSDKCLCQSDMKLLSSHDLQRGKQFFEKETEAKLLNRSACSEICIPVNIRKTKVFLMLTGMQSQCLLD